MKHLLMMIILSSVGLAHAGDQDAIKRRLKAMFDLGSNPIVANYVFEEARLRNLKKDLDVDTDTGTYADREFCLDEKFVWSLVPLSAKKLNRMVNANHPRCRKFRVDNYPSANLSLARDEFHFDLPYDMNSLNREIRQIWENKRTVILKRSIPTAYNKLKELAENSKLSSMEVCAAVAITQVMEEFKADLQGPKELISVGSWGIYSSLEYYDAYKTRIKFLALTVGDWWVRTKGNSNLCPNFGLELRVEELEGRVSIAERRISKALAQNADLRSEIQKMQKPNYGSAAALLMFGFMGYKALTPR